VDPVPADALRGFVAQVFRTRGFTEAHAAVVADALLWANLRGIDTHGVVRLAQYLRHLDDGDMNARPELRTLVDMPAAVLIDADRAAGPVAMSAALDAALGKARSAGMGMALARSTTHTAALGYYTARAAAAGFAAFAMSGAPPQMAYHGARGRAVSTSPFSIAVPGEPHPVVFDMASSVVGLGKLLQTARQGGEIAQGWATDEAGEPTTDPAKAAVPLPMAGPKGSGLSLMIELLTGVLAGNPLIARALQEKDRRHQQNGLVIAIDVSRFGSVELFRREAGRLAGALKSLPRSDPGVEPRVPGERGQRVFEERSREGILLPAPVLKALHAIAQKSGIVFPA
jgi:LDH2 family malate/lactate/ureidoglycolate dehydrogenase